MPTSSGTLAAAPMPDSLKDCPHERRPGTTVCLHCRHAERLAAKAVRGRIFTHVMLGGAIVGVIAVAFAAATAALDGQPAVAAPAPATAARLAPAATQPSAAVATPASATRAASELPATLPAPAEQIASAATPTPERKAPAPATAPAAPLPSLYPMVPEGISPLADDMSVHRRGDTVIVHFDTELGRTRRPEKFEAIVRATLLQVYGAAAEPVLASAHPGLIAREGDLLAELPSRGVRIPTGDGTALSIWPVTRPGRDGPIVVSYRAAVLPR